MTARPDTTALHSFFAVEILSQPSEPDVFPIEATLGSAHETLCRTPTDVIGGWFGVSPEMLTPHLVEFGRLLAERGPETLLRDLLSPPSHPNPVQVLRIRDAVARLISNRMEIVVDEHDGTLAVWEPDPDQGDIGPMYVLDVLGISVLLRERDNDVYVHISEGDSGAIDKPLTYEISNGGEFGGG